MLKHTANNEPEQTLGQPDFQNSLGEAPHSPSQKGVLPGTLPHKPAVIATR